VRESARAERRRSLFTGLVTLELIEISRGRTRVVVAPEAGGRLVQIAVDAGGAWRPLLVEPGDHALLLREPLLWGSYVMAPWPGRVEGGCFCFRHRLYELPRNFAGHSIHGRGVWQAWRVEEARRDRCVLSVAFDGGWPFGGGARQEIVVRDDAVAQRVTVFAHGEAFPAGIGWHPWFRRAAGDGAVAARVDARWTYETREMIPTGWCFAPGRDLALADGPVLGERRIDACYRGLRGPLALRWGSLWLEMTRSPNIDHAVVYTPEHAVCVEPQTCAPDALNLREQRIAGTGLRLVRPGEPLVAETVWRWGWEA